VEQQATDSVAVELRNMPLLLHAAWQEYAEGLLREYLLASLDKEGEDSVQVHAEATDAISILEEHVPQLSVRIAPDELMSDAVEPRVSVRLLDVPVPRASVPHFQTLDRAIEAALDLSRLGLVLTPPTPPEVQAFRRWLCGQVLVQAAGRRSEPWLLPAGDAPDPVPLPDEPPAVPAAVVLADETSRIVAVGTEVAALLGYDPAELVGERLVSIIPERYRQAHVAGFTMYLLVDRRPLVGHTVAVPALRRDGSEVSVDLLIREQPAGEGHTLLFAELRPRQG
jgi:PAS domain S-box-containing protein